MDSTCLEARLCTGEALFRQGLYTKAVEEFEKILAVDPSNEKAKMMIKETLESQDTISSLIEHSVVEKSKVDDDSEEKRFRVKSNIDKRLGSDAYDFVFETKKRKK
jgi:tetratricopeptide (TPR) repeat protein